MIRSLLRPLGHRLRGRVADVPSWSWCPALFALCGLSREQSTLAAGACLYLWHRGLLICLVLHRSYQLAQAGLTLPAVSGWY